jgi:hypothetical protein
LAEEAWVTKSWSLIPAAGELAVPVPESVIAGVADAGVLAALSVAVVVVVLVFSPQAARSVSSASAEIFWSDFMFVKACLV